MCPKLLWPWWHESSKTFGQVVKCVQKLKINIVCWGVKLIEETFHGYSQSPIQSTFVVAELACRGVSSTHMLCAGEYTYQLGWPSSVSTLLPLLTPSLHTCVTPCSQISPSWSVKNCLETPPPSLIGCPPSSPNVHLLTEPDPQSPPGFPKIRFSS